MPSNTNTELADLEEQLKNFMVYSPEVYSRVVGYFSTTKRWNPGKKEEWEERATFDSALTSLNHHK